MPLMPGAVAGHPLATMLAARAPGRLALGGSDETSVVGIETGEGRRRAGPGLGDHDRSGRLAATGVAGLAAMAAGLVGTGFSTVAAPAAGVELGPADGTVAVGIEPVEPGGGARGAPGLTGRAHFIARNRAIAVGVSAGQALHTMSDELRLAEPLVTVGVRAHGMSLRTLL